MLTMNEKIIITGESVINGVSVEGYQATIDSKNPQNISFASWQNDREVYKNNRKACRADKAKFEDLAYERQEVMLAAVTVTDDTKEA